MNFNTRTCSIHSVGLCSLLVVLFCTPLAAQTVDPDPELFDGTRTKSKETTQEENQQTDQWQEANLILYDSDEEGSQQGGQGRVGFEGPGFADGVQVGVGGVGLPLPFGGGTAGAPGQPGIPGMPEVGGSPSIPTAPTPPGASGQSTPTAGQPSGGPNAGKPGEVAIGDPSQQIAAGAKPVDKVSGTAPPPSGEEPEKSKGEDTTTIPSSASGPQSGQRGGGVEKGDAMPTDI